MVAAPVSSTFGSAGFAETRATLEELVDAESVQEMLDSFYMLFRIPLRLLNERGVSLVRSNQQTGLTKYLGGLSGGAQQLAVLSASLRALDPGQRGETSLCGFTGATYHVVAIGHDGRRVGRMVLGPYLTPEVVDVPESLCSCDPQLDVDRARELLLQLPRVRSDTLTAIARHLAVTLDVLVFTGHKLMLTEGLQLASVQDSERRLADKEGELRREQARASAAECTKDDVLDAVARHLSTSVDEIIRLGAGLSAAQGPLSDEFREVAAQISCRANAMKSTLDDVRDFSRSAVSRKRLDPRKLLEDVKVLLDDAAARRSLSLKVRCDPSIACVWGDERRLRDALVRLGRNALAFSPEGGQVNIVATRLNNEDSDRFVLLEPAPCFMEVRVSDAGIGIPESERRRVVEPFCGPEGRGGMGLAVARRHIEVHGGTLRLEHNEPTGAVVVLTLPLGEP